MGRFLCKVHCKMFTCPTMNQKRFKCARSNKWGLTAQLGGALTCLVNSAQGQRNLAFCVKKQRRAHHKYHAAIRVAKFTYPPPLDVGHGCAKNGSMKWSSGKIALCATRVICQTPNSGKTNEHVGKNCLPFTKQPVCYVGVESKGASWGEQLTRTTRKIYIYIYSCGVSNWSKLGLFQSQ